MNQSSSDNLTILLHPQDDVAIARVQLMSGSSANGVPIKGLIPPGHKVARHAIAAGQPVRRYQQIIGFASQAIAPGEHVHTHNLVMGDFERDYAFGVDVQPPAPRREAQFQGIRRAKGQVATRNYIGILTSVNCSATVARAIADHFARRPSGSPLDAYPQVDGVVALTHGAGCAMDEQGLGMRVLRRTLAGYALHPNFAAVLVVGLGCEANQIGALLQSGGLQEGAELKTFNIQQAGGTRQAVAQGIALVESFLPQANDLAQFRQTPG